MKCNKMTRNFRICLAACFLIFLTFPAWAETIEKAATVDDLFKFLLDNWANKLNISASEDDFIKEPFHSDLAQKSNLADVFESFTNDLIAAEKTFGNLPEYWELRAHLDIQPRPDWKLSDTQAGDETFSNHPGNSQCNPVMLQKALDIDPTRGSDQWYIGISQIKNQIPERIKWDDPAKAVETKNYCMLMLEITAKATAAEPNNAFYPLYEAAYEYHLSHQEMALDALKRAGACEYFSFPRIFPSTYALSHINQYESGKIPFFFMPPGAKWHLFTNFYNNADSLPNYNLIRNMYKGFIADVISKSDWRETFNILNRAACVIGMGERNEHINHLVANGLVRFCLSKAMIHAKKEKDSLLERAVAVAINKTDEIKLMSEIPDETSESDLDIAYVISIILDQVDKTSGKGLKLNISPSKVLPPILRKRVVCQIHTKYITPTFQTLITFDYQNPDEWYNNWYRETFPEEKKE